MGRSLKNNIYILNHYAVYQELTQYFTPTILSTKNVEIKLGGETSTAQAAVKMKRFKAGQVLANPLTHQNPIWDLLFEQHRLTSCGHL